MAEYDNIPSRATVKVDKFKISISDEQISDLKTLLRLSPLAPETYENLHTDNGRYGVSYEWMKKAKDHWLNEYDWSVSQIPPPLPLLPSGLQPLKAMLKAEAQADPVNLGGQA